MTFTASNGVEMWLTENGELKDRIRRDNGTCILNNLWVAAVREFFQHERDEELGRWRWPENPDYVVYAQGDGWIVASERSANSKHYSHREHAQVGTSILTQAMRAYFEAHPESKPWHDAKAGDAWVLTINGSQLAVTLDEDREFRDPEFPREHAWMHIQDVRITAGRKIWPEPS